MSDTTTASILFAAVGLLYTGLGIPLLRGKVKPNLWYGCRTEKTLADERLWYEVNRVTGRDLIVAGIVVVISSLVVFLLARHINSTFATLILLAVLLIAVGVMVINSLRTQKQSSRARGA